MNTKENEWFNIAEKIKTICIKDCDQNCCKLLVEPTSNEIEIIEKETNIKSKDFMEDLYLKRLNNNYCLFYNGKCSIYSIRPRWCKKFMCKGLLDLYNKLYMGSKSN